MTKKSQFADSLTATIGLGELRGALVEPDVAFGFDAPGSVDAAVLLPLRPVGDSIHVVLTRRHVDLSKHAGEISFPGGRHDQSDADLQTTALREANEEIGLDPAAVQILGALPPVGTFVTDFRVYPFVGTIAGDATLYPNAAEVEEIVEFSVEQLVSSHRLREFRRDNTVLLSHAFEIDDVLVWGATARILAELLGRVAGDQWLADRR